MAFKYSAAQLDDINKLAAKSSKLLEPTKSITKKSINSDIAEMSQKVIDYFKDSPAILIESASHLHEYVTAAIECGYAGIDTETTGLDRVKDTIVGASLYYPGGVECYIPMRHLVPIFDEPYKGQLSYAEVEKEFQRLADSNIKLIFANADFDLAMIYKDIHVDLCKVCYYDVILAWRCLKENEKDNALKVLYNKYVLRGKGDPMKFRDFFTPQLFPYCKPEVAKLYAANDAKITYDLFAWQLPYVTKDHPKCKKAHLESIADLVWNVEMPLIEVCQRMHRTGVYLDKDVASVLMKRYNDERSKELEKLAGMVDEILEKSTTVSSIGKRPFTRGSEFNPGSPPHVKYLLYTVMNLPKGKNGESTDKAVLGEMNLPVTKQILKVRSLGVLISTFVDKLPKATTPDSRIHAQFRQIGADTGRMSSAEPNMQNIPSHATDIRHMFRASPGYVMLSSDYSQQEPKLTAFVSQDEKMIQSFKDGRDIYATIASLAFNLPYEKCLEFHPQTGEYQPDGKARRGEAKTIVLGITYGRSVTTIADQLFGANDEMSQEDKVKGAQKIYDSVLNAFPQLRTLMINAQKMARTKGYVETILGRRRHLPDMQLPEFEFQALPGYVNPDVDPLDMSTLQNRSDIPERIIQQLTAEFKGYKYFGQIARRTRELYEDEHIRVINNRPKITDATRQCVNCVDYDTEILTKSGWKRYDQVVEGDQILSYSLSTHEIVDDVVQAVHIYDRPTEVVRFESPTFSSVSTWDHRWVAGEADEVPRIRTSREIFSHKWPDYPILRVADNSFEANDDISDEQLKILGWFFTDGNRGGPHYAIHLYQSVRREKNAAVYEDMISTLSSASIECTDACRDGYYHEIYLKQNDFTKWVWDEFTDRIPTFDFISTLSQRQSEILLRAMLQGDGSGVDGHGDALKNSRVSLLCRDAKFRDAFQYLCFRAGYASNSSFIDASLHDNPSNHVLYPSMSNIPSHEGTYYDTCVLKITRAQIYPHHKHVETTSGVWCVTTQQGTWIARRAGKVYITGNSIIQGSAAEQTKLAILRLEHNEEWKAIGGRLLVPVHDELIAEVPMDKWKEGGEILSRMMVEAADFLPFASKCDVTTTLRWYGLEYPCPYTRPTSLENLTPDEIKWVQYHLCELEYQLPVFKDENGEKPRGDAALGVNGIISEEYDRAIAHYRDRYSITSDEQFIEHIDNKVCKGV